MPLVGHSRPRVAEASSVLMNHYERTSQCAIPSDGWLVLRLPFEAGFSKGSVQGWIVIKVPDCVGVPLSVAKRG